MSFREANIVQGGERTESKGGSDVRDVESPTGEKDLSLIYRLADEKSRL